MEIFDADRLISERLISILSEMKLQDDLAVHYSPDRLSFAEEMEQIREFVEDVGEYSLAYECIVVNLEKVPREALWSEFYRTFRGGFVYGL